MGFGDDKVAWDNFFSSQYLGFSSVSTIAPYLFIYESGQSVGFLITAVSQKWKESEKVNLCRPAASH